MKASTGLVALIILLAASYTINRTYRYVISVATAKTPNCLALLGYTTREEEGRTFIVGSIRNDCGRTYGNLQITFQLPRSNDLMARSSVELPAGVAYAYGRDLKPGEIWRFKTLFPVSKDAVFQLGEITAY